MEINIEDFDEIIRRVISKYPKQLQDDLYQECALKILELSQKKDFVGDKISFRNYCAVSIKYVCQQFRNNESQYINSLDNSIGTEDGEEIRFSDLIRDNLELDCEMDIINIIELLYDRLLPKEIRLLELSFVEGYSPKEISELFPELGYGSISTIRRTVKRIIDQLPKYK